MGRKLHTGYLPVDLGYVGKTVARFWSKVDRRGPDDCWQWLGPLGAIDIAGNRYGRFSVQVDCKGCSINAHRFAWFLTNGEFPAGAVIRHKCDNTQCCNPAHLEPGSQGDNVRDAVRRGRALHGEKNGRSKLTESDVLYIRNSSKTNVELAKKFGVDPSTVGNARRGKKWQSVARA